MGSSVTFRVFSPSYAITTAPHSGAGRTEPFAVLMLMLCAQKSESNRDDRGASAAVSGVTSAGGIISPSGSTHDDLGTGLATERQQHGALPDLLPPQIPPRASHADKSVSDEVLSFI